MLCLLYLRFPFIVTKCTLDNLLTKNGGKGNFLEGTVLVNLCQILEIFS